MFGKTNAGGGSGSFASSTDAVVEVYTGPNTSVVMSRDGKVISSASWLESNDNNKLVHLLPVKQADFSASTWDVTATAGNSQLTRTLTVNSNKLYRLDMAARLPYEYQEVEYIQSNGNQYINTGVGARYIGRIVLKTKIISDSQYACLFGACGSASAIENTETVAYRPYDGAFFLDQAGHQVASVMRSTTGSDYTLNAVITASSLTTTIDPGTRVETGGTIGTLTTVNLWLFANAYITTFLAGCSARMYFTQLYSKADGSLQRNFVPAKRKSDSVVGMYDLVTSTFYTNSGTGSFTAGPDV